MHMSGTPMTMQLNPTYADVVNDTVTFFQQRLHELTGFGIEQSRITIDPGIGFGKTLEQTITQLRYIKAYSAMGRPICLGVSRKGFLGQITGRDRFERLSGTLAVNSFAIAMGAAQIIRVHDVAAHRDAARLAGAILTP
jgi:dihydropteroate synthase